MEKKSILAIALIALVMIVWAQFFYKKPPANVVPPAPTAATNPAQPGASAPGGTPVAVAAAEPASNLQATNKAPVVISPLDSSNLKTELSSQTGFPEHWWLKKYFIQPGGKGPNIDLLTVSPPSLPLQLILTTDGHPTAPYFPTPSAAAKSLSYSNQIGPWNLNQTVELGKIDYTLDVHISLENQSDKPQSVAPGLRLTVDQNTTPGKGFLIFKEAPNLRFPLFRLGTAVERKQKELSKMGPLQEQVGEISWGGIEDRYFLRILIPKLVSSQNKVSYGVVDNQVFSQLQYPSEVLGSGQKKDYAFTVYLGPKDPDLLDQLGEIHLSKAIDYGWFSYIALGILYSLKFFNGFLHNWGLAIILLTVLIKILLQPLTRKSMKSMKAMQELQPQLQRIREKYKDDRERLNTETMNLFKANKVNPAGGCLPMLLQMPIYIALYKVLYNATDLYHAPFFGFYRDLSAPDPYYILPVLLGIFMVLQQRMTPSPGDPSQAKMMMIMPVMFSAFMLFLPLGLVLYIFVNTSMTVVQQYLYQKNISLIDLVRGKKAQT